MIGVPDLVVICLRALSFIASFQAAGAVLFVAVFLSRLPPSSLRDNRRLASITAFVAIVLTISQHALGPARMTGEFGDVFDASLQRFLFESGAGTAVVARVIGLGLILLAFNPNQRAGLILAVFGAILVPVSFVAMGHTATHDPGWLLSPLLIMHLLVASFWFGALLPLRRILEHESAATARELLFQFSTLAVRAVPMLFVAGVALAALLLGSWSRLMTPYGWILLLKTAGFALLMALAALNRWRLTPRMGSEQSVTLALNRSIAGEWIIIAAILTATATMTALFSPDA